MASEDGEEKVIATAQHIVKALGATETMTDDMIHIFSKFDHRFSGMSEALSRKSQEYYASEGLQDVLDSVEERIMKWDMATSESARERFIWSDVPSEASSYLEAVEDVQNMIAKLSLAPDDRKDFPCLDRAQNVLQQAMARLEEEFKMLLERHSESVDPEWLFDPITQPSFSSSNNDEKASHTSAEDEDEDEDDEDDLPVAQPVTDLNFTIDMLPSDIVADLNRIAKCMVGAGYMAECCHVYVTIRRMFLEESVFRLGFEKQGIEEVQNLEWEVLEMEISKWMQVMKVTVHVFFTSERKLCERVFVDLPSVSETCFVELARGVMVQLLNFAEAVVISRRSPERLFKILDMYETLRDLLPEINSLFSGEDCFELRSEASTIWMRLAEAARGTFFEFENAIQRDSAKNPVPGGAVHPLTRYVMNYMRFACDYKETLEQVLGDDRGEDPRVFGGVTNRTGILSPDNRKDSADELSPWSIQTSWLMDLLKGNLDAKSKLYKDPALSHLFLMNNGRYIVQKVKDTEIGSLLGNDWVRKHAAKVRQYHKNYQRIAWCKAIACLRDEGTHSSGNFSSGVCREVLKERFKSFNTLFEEIHKVQSAWTVADDQLRTELRISIAEMVIPAYRSFLGRFQQYLESGKHPEKYIKYSPEDLETYINELFEGTSGSMSKRRSS